MMGANEKIINWSLLPDRHAPVNPALLQIGLIPNTIFIGRRNRRIRQVWAPRKASAHLYLKSCAYEESIAFIESLHSLFCAI